METGSAPAPASTADMDVLRTLADGGTMDYSRWPSVLAALLSRLNTIALTVFPISNLPPPPPRPQSTLPRPAAPGASSSPSAQTQPTPSQENKENADPTPASAPTSASAGAASASPPRAVRAARAALEPGALPPQLSSMLDEIVKTLSANFPAKPPHTVQRLAELILAPRAYYKSLASYLHALDRVVHVTSSVDNYPLPPAVIGVAEANGDVHAGSTYPLASNGTAAATTTAAAAAGAGGEGAGGGGAGGGAGAGAGGASAAAAAISWANPTASVAAVGSDEALGGALLTPIPWLNRAEDAEGELEDDAVSMDGASSGGGSATANIATATAPPRATIRSESTETIEGPNGMGSVETVSVSVHGVPSTGAGVRTGGSHSPSSASSATLDVAPTPTTEQGSNGNDNDEDEVPHARGPQEVGAEDLGPQPANAAAGGVSMDNLDLEAAVGQRPRASKPPEVARSAAGAEGGGDAMDTDTDKVGMKREAKDEPEGAEAAVKKVKDGPPEPAARLAEGPAEEKDDIKMED